MRISGSLNVSGHEARKIGIFIKSFESLECLALKKKRIKPTQTTFAHLKTLFFSFAYCSHPQRQKCCCETVFVTPKIGEYNACIIFSIVERLI